jgi:hypothetical protein
VLEGDDLAREAIGGAVDDAHAACAQRLVQYVAPVQDVGRGLACDGYLLWIPIALLALNKSLREW